MSFVDITTMVSNTYANQTSGSASMSFNFYDNQFENVNNAIARTFTTTSSIMSGTIPGAANLTN